MKKIIYVLSGSLLIVFIASSLFAQELPCDKKATKETIALYKNLKKLLNRGIMFGHQDDLAYGVNWKYQPDRSDIKDVCGDYPAVYGWELGHLEMDAPVNLDSVPFDKMKQLIREGYGRGGIITISWHFNNPLTGKSAWEPAPGTVASILPGGEKHSLYKSWLDKLANFLNDLKDKNGRYIPVIFRPFHELNGSWFWWGKNHCTPDELKQLYRSTEVYLRDVKNVHHLLYAYNTDRYQTKEEYLERYPGDEWVDVVGFDVYQRGADNQKFLEEFDHYLTMLDGIAKDHGKVPALTEFGYGRLPDSTWWTSTFIKGLMNHKISYALAWRNSGCRPDGRCEYYVPYKGEPSAADFVKFYRNPLTIFESDLPDMYK